MRLWEIGFEEREEDEEERVETIVKTPLQFPLPFFFSLTDQKQRANSRSKKQNQELKRTVESDPVESCNETEQLNNQNFN